MKRATDGVLELLQRRDRKAIVEHSERAAVAVVWATGRVFPVRPGFDEQIHGWRPTRVVAEPFDPSGLFETWLDAQGRPVIRRLHAEYGLPTEYLAYVGDGMIEEWSFSAAHEVVGLGLTFRKNGLVTDYRYVGTDGRRQTETFAYDEHGRLRVLRRVHGDGPENVFTHEYDGAGRLERITLAVGQKSGVVWERPKRSKAALGKAVRNRLVELVPQRVAAHRPSDPIVRVALLYDPQSVHSILPPHIAISSAPSYDAHEWPQLEDLDDPELLADCRELAADGDVDGAYDILEAVAKALKKKALWTVPLAKGFEVFPADVHGGDEGKPP
jgi:hypothetical protein